MVMYNQLPIFRDSYELLLKIYQETSQFAKDYKYSLGQDMKRDCLNMIRDIYFANMNVQQRQEYLDSFFGNLELLKMEIRLSIDLKVMSVRKQAHLSLLIDTIAKQAKAWRKKSAEINEK